MNRPACLLTPGPTPVPDSVLSELGKPMIHHRTPQYRQIFREVTQGLKEVFQTKNDILTLTSSGTGAMEAAVVSLVNPGEEVIVVRGGKFGERWEEIARAYGARVIPIDVPWGEPVRVEAVKKTLHENPGAAVLFATVCETSTGVTNDIKAVAEVTRRSQTLLVVDAISSLGAEEFYQDQWGIDAAVAGSQKALMLPPGLSFVSAGQRAWSRMEKIKTPRYYFNLPRYRKSLAEDDVPFTPAISLVIGLREALRLIQEEGMQKVFERHRKLAQAVRAGINGLGLELFARTPCNVLTAVKVPDKVNGTQLVSYLRDERGVTLAGGQAELKGKIWRIAHLGAIGQEEILLAFSELEPALEKFGYPVKPGSGVNAVKEVFSRRQVVG